MAKRNLNEVLGFISRWGDSKFSIKLSEELGPDPQAEHEKLKKQIDQIKKEINSTNDWDEKNSLSALLTDLTKKHRMSQFDVDDRKKEWDAAKAAADTAKAAADEEEKDTKTVDAIGPEEKPKGSGFFSKIANFGKDEHAGGIEGKGEKPSRTSNILGKISSFAGKAGEIGGALAAISSMGSSLSQGAIKMGRAQTGKRDVMGASVGGLTQTLSGVSSGFDRVGVAADRLEDERQIKDATKKIEAQMRGLKTAHAGGKLTANQKKIAAEKYAELEKQRNALRSGNKFHAARLQRMLDLLNTGRTNPKSGGSPKP